MQQPTAHVPAPEFTVDATGTARSVSFDDVYFSARGGAAETEHVFLAGNQLPQRWQGRACFTIGELGFGTGLNFLVAWKRFVESTTLGTLHFVSIEKFPLTPDQLRAAWAHQPELAAYAQQLIDRYPLRLPGLHRVWFNRVCLTLGFGDVAALLPEIDASVDAWFLDGFAPAKNAAMWEPPVLQQIARLSAAGATVATFTAAGAVKRGLQEVGFTMEKVRGFAHKRDMLVGHRPESASPKTASVQPVIVIGGGIAGCTVARALAERGVQVRLLEKATVAAGASGNPAAVLYPQLTKYYTPATAWHFTAYGFMLRQLQRWQHQELNFTLAQPGMLKIGKDAEDEARLRALQDTLQLDPAIAQWLERTDAARACAQEVAHGGYWFAQGTWLKPAELCRAMLRHPNIHVEQHYTVERMERYEGHTVVLANAQAANDLLPQPLGIGISAGQVSAIDARALPQPLRAVLCHKGYAVPAGDRLIIGATYDRHDLGGAVTDRNHAQNMAELRQAIADVRDVPMLAGRTSLRATTPSRLPHVGQVAPNMYVSVGHGSRGMISAPLAAELIAAELCGEPSPLTRALRRALAPRP